VHDEGLNFRTNMSLRSIITRRTAIVTGAAQGIGKAIAIRLAHDGFDVALNDLPPKISNLQDVQKEIELVGRKGIIETGDISREEVVKELIKHCVDSLGSLDVMVANAGIGPAKSFLECKLFPCFRARNPVLIYLTSRRLTSGKDIECKPSLRLSMSSICCAADDSTGARRETYCCVFAIWKDW
jgi:hypothetical protein